MPLALLLAVLSLAAAAFAQRPVVCIGGLFPLTNHLAGAERAAAGHLAVEAINNSTAILPNLDIRLSVRDTARRPENGVRAALDIFEIDRCPVIVGAASSSVTRAASSIVDLFNAHIVSYASTSPTLSNKDLYPNVLRTVPPDTIQGRVIVDVIVGLGADHMAMMTSADDFGQGIAKVLRSAAQASGQSRRTEAARLPQAAR